MARRRPYRQGNLDGLCGVYAIVNAIDLLHPLKFDNARKLFIRLIRELDRRGALTGAITFGVGRSRAWKLLKLAARHTQQEHGNRLYVRRPFRRRGLISFEAFYAALEQELGRGAVAIIGILGESGHWTVLHRIGPVMLQLHDSDGHRAIRRSSCRLDGADAESRFEIDQAATMILHRRAERRGAAATGRARVRRPGGFQRKLNGKAASSRRRPYRQGHLDSLCGLYAVLNAIDLLHPLDAGVRSGLTSRLIGELEKRSILADAIARGITGSLVWRFADIAAQFLCEQEGVRLALDRPFRDRLVEEPDEFFRALEGLLVGGSVAIICITGRFDLPHWTVVRRVTETTIQLRDSAGMRYLRRLACRVRRSGAPSKPALLTAATVVLSLV